MSSSSSSSSSSSDSDDNETVKQRRNEKRRAKMVRRESRSKLEEENRLKIEEERQMQLKRRREYLEMKNKKEMYQRFLLAKQRNPNKEPITRMIAETRNNQIKKNASRTLKKPWFNTSPYRERQIVTPRMVESSQQIDEESHYLARQRAQEQFSFNFVNAAGIALLSFLFIPRIDYCPDSSHSPEEPCLVKYNEYMTVLQVIILAATTLYYQHRPGLFTKEVKEIFDEDEMDGGGSKDDIFLENIGMIEMLIGNKLINSEKEKLKEWYESPGSKIVVFQNNRKIINISSFDFVKILETKVKPFIMEQSKFDRGKKKTQKRKKSRKHK
jgi:hypothetical protein